MVTLISVNAHFILNMVIFSGEGGKSRAKKIGQAELKSHISSTYTLTKHERHSKHCNLEAKVFRK